MIHDQHGKVKAKYIHGSGIDEHLAVEQKEHVYYYHADGLGSIVALTDNKQHVAQTYEYDSFGDMKQQGNKVKQPYTFTGREYDSETGLYYYRARYYDAKNGRFISKDTIGFAGGDVNLYRYVKNNPLIFTDPSGNMPETPGEWISFINRAKKLGKICYECNDIEKHMQKGGGPSGIHDECMSCCIALSKGYEGVMKNAIRDACVAKLCMKK